MRPLPNLPQTQISDISAWSNFHHTIVNRHVPAYLTPGALGVPQGLSQGQALTPDLNAILQYCFDDPPERLCVIGSRWSLSDILDPAAVLLDGGAWNQIAAVSQDWITPEYRQTRAAVPVVAQGGCTIGTLNRVLGAANLSLQTSAASDGHRLAGLIATGTHGSHPKVGAVHDTVLGILLVTQPGQASFVQPSVRHFTSDLTQWFRDQTTLGVDDVADDELFAAVQVGLGGLGFVHSVVIEAVPLYELVGLSVARPLYDPDVWQVIETLDASVIGAQQSPDFLSFVLSPFADDDDDGSFGSWLCKQPPTRPFAAPGQARARIATDLSQLLSRLVPLVDLSGLGASLIGHVVASQTSAQYGGGGPVGPAFPGNAFGPTTLPEGNGRSVEVVVDHQDVRAAAHTVIETLRREGMAGRHLLGGMSVRFAKQSTALLGMNIHPMNAYIEFPSLDSPDTSTIHRAVFDQLRSAGVSFTCHWGQEYLTGMDAQSVRQYFGDRVDRWKAARRALLPSEAARAVFTNPLIERLGLV